MRFEDLKEVDVAESVMLRWLNDGEAAELFAITDKNRIFLRRWLPWLDGNKTAEDSLRFIQWSSHQREAGKALTYGIWSGGMLAGVITAFLDPPNRSAVIGYWIGEDMQRKGLVTRSVETLIRYLFLDLELHRISLRIAPSNTRSRAIPQKLGFKLEGTLREDEWLYDHFSDSCVYGLLRREWEAWVEVHIPQ